MGSSKSGGGKRARKNSPTRLPPTLRTRNVADAGDTTARNYRYQYAYGVVILVAGRTGTRPYVALWCEHYEDFLAERTDGRFDGYQIKTSRPELGAWTLKDPELIKSIGRFVDLSKDLGPQLGDLFFVTNTECDQVSARSADERRRGRCPSLLLDHIRQCNDVSEIQEPYRTAFTELATACACTEADAFSVLRVTYVIVGPSRSDFDAVLSHEHLTTLEECRSLNQQQLDTFRDGLIAQVHRASSLHVSGPLRYLARADSDIPQEVLAKRILVASVKYDTVLAAPTFMQFRGAPRIDLSAHRLGVVLEEKLGKGGLGDHIEYMRDRGIAAEQHLFEDIHRRPEQYPGLLNQVEKMVLGECTEAYLSASQAVEPYGAAMLIDVQRRLRELARERPQTVGYHPYECLVGMAALLTSDCQVWWSPRFKISPGSL